MQQRRSSTTDHTPTPADLYRAEKHAVGLAHNLAKVQAFGAAGDTAREAEYHRYVVSGLISLANALGYSVTSHADILASGLDLHGVLDEREATA